MIPHDTYLCHPVAAPFRVGMDCTFCRTSRHACLPVSTTVGALCHHARTAGVMRAPPATVSPRVGLHHADRLHQVLRLGTDMPPPKGGDALHPHRQPLMPGSVAADPRHASGTCSRSTVSGAPSASTAKPRYSAFAAPPPPHGYAFLLERGRI